MDETDWGKFKDEFLSLLKKVVPLLSGKSVLNLFADGSLCCYLRKLGARVIGIDRGDAVQERRGAEREDEPNPDPYSFADLGKERFDLIFSAMPFSAAAVAKMSRSVARMINHEGFFSSSHGIPYSPIDVTFKSYSDVLQRNWLFITGLYEANLLDFILWSVSLRPFYFPRRRLPVSGIKPQEGRRERIGK